MPSFDTLDPGLKPWAEWLKTVAEYNGLTVQITSTRRTWGQQNSLWQRFLACQGDPGAFGGRCLPAAPPGHSAHEKGLAFDLVVNGDFRSPEQEALGRYWQSLGGLWGASADPVHFGVRS